MQPKFVHLGLHTEYSIVDGIVRIKPLLQRCREQGMAAVAITDRCNFFGLVKFYQAAIRSGIKPIIGADVLLKTTEQHLVTVTFLCQNQIGYKNLTKLISRAYLEGRDAGGVPLVTKEWIAELAEGLIVISGGVSGEIGRTLLAGHKKVAIKLLQWWQQCFPGRYYLQLQRTGREHEENYIAEVLQLAKEYMLPVVATNAVRFVQRDDFEAHEARVCVHDGYVLEDSKRPKNYTEQQYLRSAEEMQELFADIPAALENSVEIAKRCNVKLVFDQVFLPKFPIPSGITVADYLVNEAEEGMRSRQLLAERQNDYEQRLAYELKIINQMGFAGYFLIVADFIRWAKENDIPVGPGRGSGAGSLVAYVLKITDLDPIEHELLFERFLNPERVSMPDFDIDFCMEGRDRVIEYVAKRYGRDSVAQIITYGTMAARAVVRDVGRVLGHPYGFVDTIAKLIPFEIGITLDKALLQEELLAQRYDNEDEVRMLIDLAKKLEGLTRNAGKHAGGVVIAPSALTDFTPIYCEEKEGSIVTQFDKGDVEAVGLVKFDFLGLRTLTIIHWAVQAINIKRQDLGEELLNIENIPLDDPLTYKLLKSCATTAVFQLESRGMRDLIKRLKPDSFADIVALVALFRPGPLQSGMVDDFIERKHGRAVVKYLHPELIPVLDATYGVILYQEQVMQIAQILAGYSLGSADLLRRAMGKKKPEEMAKHRVIFMEGAIKHGIDKHVANTIFDLMEKFAGYGFNKSHSAGYALIAYQTAWLKAHYPAEFMAAVLSSDMDNTDKVVNFVNECRQMQLKIISPNINHSAYKFAVNPTGEIVYGLGAIKGVGSAAIAELTANREQQKEYSSLFDLCARVDTRKANKRVLEALIKAGALDGIGPHRGAQFASIGIALKAAEQEAQHAAAGQGDLFAGLQDEADNFKTVDYVEAAEWSDETRLLAEKETLGLYLTGHPIAAYEPELQHYISGQIAKLNTANNQGIVIAGFVSAIKTLFTKRGKRMAVITLEDRSGRIEVTLFSESFNKYRELLVPDQLLVIAGDLAADSFSGGYRVQARDIYTFAGAREHFAKCLLLELADSMPANIINKLMAVLTPHKNGGCLVYISYSADSASSKLLLGEEWSVNPSDELLNKLKQLLGPDKVKVIYR